MNNLNKITNPISLQILLINIIKSSQQFFYNPLDGSSFKFQVDRHCIINKTYRIYIKSLKYNLKRLEIIKIKTILSCKLVANCFFKRVEKDDTS